MMKSNCNNCNKSFKKWSFVFLILMIAALVPILAVGQYAMPRADDFSFGTQTRNVWLTSHSIFAVWKEAIKVVVYYYYTWQGTYSSIMLMTLQPGIWSEKLYAFVPAFGMGILGGGIFYFFYCIIRKGMKQSIYHVFLIASIVFLFMIQDVPCYAEAFFWYNSYVHYTFGFSVLLLTIGLFISIYFEEEKYMLQSSLFSVGCFLLGGSNLLTVLQSLLLAVLSVVVLCLLRKYQFILRYLVGYGVLAIGSIINLTAPGNIIRKESFQQESAGIVETILGSFKEGIRLCFHNITTINLLMILILLPFLAALMYFYVTSHKCHIQFRCPLLVWLGSYCLISAMYAPLVFTKSGIFDRSVNIIQMTFMVLLTISIGYTWGWFWAKEAYREKWNGLLEENRNRMLKCYGIVVVIISILLGGYHGLTYPTDYTSLASVVYLANGSAKQYAKECTDIFMILNDDTIEEAILPPITANCRMFLCQNDMEWENILWREGARDYFHKKQVRFTFELEEADK